MKRIPLFALLNAGLAVVSAQLAFAAFTPALFLFFALLPLAVLFAYKGQFRSALVVVAAALLAWLLTPLRLDEADVWLQMTWLVWAAFCSALIIWLSLRRSA